MTNQYNHSNQSLKPQYGVNRQQNNSNKFQCNGNYSPLCEPSSTVRKGGVNNTIPHDSKSHDIGVCLPYEYIEQLLLTITANAKALNTASQLFYNRAELADFKPMGRKEINTLANQINDISMQILDIADSLSEVVNDE
ncbi:hypothetical protein [Psychrobacter sp. I-STPA6b]|uniref:hypothetical protein n=1 Tax=Psychrobacter sp. I-STPA6b TaxID=2585718 RepID=UPI001D0CB88B|nr:hypothetical protein [Psychrobacter sp. I-STPA6b]